MIVVENILEEREKTHGAFSEHASFTQQIKAVMRPRRHKCTVTQNEALEMIAHKIGRILAGDPNYKDHWDDIAGYATLVSKELDQKLAPTPVPPRRPDPQEYQAPVDRHQVDKYKAFKV
jgi:hypothetical protein